jgi:hypothetical protein
MRPNRDQHALFALLQIADAVRLHELMPRADPHTHTRRGVSARKFGVRVIECCQTTASTHLRRYQKCILGNKKKRNAAYLFLVHDREQVIAVTQCLDHVHQAGRERRVLEHAGDQAPFEAEARVDSKEKDV